MRMETKEHLSRTRRPGIEMNKLAGHVLIRSDLGPPLLESERNQIPGSAFRLEMDQKSLVDVYEYLEARYMMGHGGFEFAGIVCRERADKLKCLSPSSIKTKNYFAPKRPH